MKPDWVKIIAWLILIALSIGCWWGLWELIMWVWP